MERTTLKILEYLEKIFPRTMVTDSETLISVGGDVDSINILEKDKLIEKAARGTPGISSAVSYRITSLGIQFLDQVRQKRTNDLLLTLTILFTLFSLAQLILMLLRI